MISSLERVQTKIQPNELEFPQYDSSLDVLTNLRYTRFREPWNCDQVATNHPRKLIFASLRKEHDPNVLSLQRM